MARDGDLVVTSPSYNITSGKGYGSEKVVQGYISALGRVEEEMWHPVPSSLPANPTGSLHPELRETLVNVTTAPG